MCCKDFKYHLKHRCTQHDKYECPDTILYRFNSGIIVIGIKDGGCSGIEIKYCPWCGKKIETKDPK